jgi:sulfate permease, SulP family
VRFRFRPQLLDSLKTYQSSDLRHDIGAGITVGVVALPLAMAFGIASGVKPEQGLITAIVAGLLISLLGGSKFQIGGPAGAFVALLYGIAERYGVANLLISTLMAGVLLFAMGALRLGGLIRFVPLPVVIGFTNGIAVIIALQQIRDALGLQMDKVPAGFFAQLGALGRALPSLQWGSVVVCTLSIALMWIWPKLYRQPTHRWQRGLAYIPGTLLVLLLGAIAVQVLDLPLTTIGSRFGELPSVVRAPEWPKVDWATVQYLAAPAISIALLGGIESLLCARVADGMTKQKHDPNQELMAQGIANVVSPLFGGIAATGTVARTVTNIRTGARSPIAGIVHAVTLLGIVVVLAPLAAMIPMASLAAILLFVAFNMGDWQAFRRAEKFSKNYQLILWATFALTVMFDITVALEVGLMLACLFFIVRVSGLTRIEALPEHALSALVAAHPELRERAAGRRMGFRVFGSLFFGSTAKVEALTETLRDRLTEAGATGGADVVLELEQMINIDSSALEALGELVKVVHEHGGQVALIGLNEQPHSIIHRTGFVESSGVLIIASQPTGSAAT